MRKKSKRVIPGFGLSLGVTISILSICLLYTSDAADD